MSCSGSPGRDRGRASFVTLKRLEPSGQGQLFLVNVGFHDPELKLRVVQVDGYFRAESLELVPPPPGSDGRPAPLGEHDRRLAGVRLDGKSVGYVEEQLGKPESEQRSEGRYTRAYRGGSVLVTYLDRGKDPHPMVSIEIRSGMTPRGLAIGDSRDRVLQLYGGTGSERITLPGQAALTATARRSCRGSG